MCAGIVYGGCPSIRNYSMSQRKDAKNSRNYLVKCTCPHCNQQSEHSFSRVQKGAMLMCPRCSKLFSQGKTAFA
ncbi:YnfU family zinc-binding protein [Franconibacter pulveris 1160]|uniref:YnfU family zinc-binding protein n=1 Tax=Franconibacter TaxID=1649295 RepID=UPI0027E5080E|nr:YnfU family zinc-binding protein [Franconibacter daqui]